MFTGLVEEVGRLTSRPPAGGGRIGLEARKVLEGTVVGDSIAVDGVCLTVEGLGEGSFTCSLSRETAGRTTLGKLSPGARVNLERALPLGGRLGGHLVSGHVEAVGKIVRMPAGSGGGEMEVAFPREFGQYVVGKGSVAVDGVSLTVAERRRESFTVSLVPETLRQTTMQLKRPGDSVNLEPDIILKYVKFTVNGLLVSGGGEVTLEQLIKAGFPV